VTAWKWNVDGIRVPATPAKPPKRRTAQCGLSDTSVADVRRAIAVDFAAAEDITPPDLSTFGVALNEAALESVVGHLVRVRDGHRVRVETEVGA
jgi:hypothetical protein